MISIENNKIDFVCALIKCGNALIKCGNALNLKFDLIRDRGGQTEPEAPKQMLTPQTIGFTQVEQCFFNQWHKSYIFL